MLIENENIVVARLDPDRLKLFGQLRRKGEQKCDVIRRAIDALVEKEGKQVNKNV
ncbi:MAG: hypothetical protein WC455_23940 [Dehalococcoidia bacterium]|jgi:hypothetical protein